MVPLAATIIQTGMVCLISRFFLLQIHDLILFKQKLFNTHASLLHCCAAINPPAAAIGHAIVASPAANLNVGVVNPATSILHPIDPRLSQTVTKLYRTDII